MADALLKAYAARHALPGHAYKPDTVWQRELEASFPYEETPDQLKTIEDVRRDMETASPMDRLVCGDVGYGKTEIALRAAFKAVQDGKQVAVLVPTTILAQQHGHTFRERLADFPVKVEVISRFRTAKEQKEVVKRVAAHDVDILIGTHRLLSKDVAFADLGLVIIDEEHRFGVAQKERIRQLTRTVDVLALTATPIPRTPNLSLAGARDSSPLPLPPRAMIDVGQFRAATCAGIERRSFLRLGASAVAGLGLPGLDAAARGEGGVDGPRARSVIFVFLWGAPSHLDTCDPKPGAPLEYRGPFDPIATRTPAVTSTTARTASGDGAQPKCRPAQPAYASPRAGSRSSGYPVTPSASAPCTASITTGSTA